MKGIVRMLVLLYLFPLHAIADQDIFFEHITQSHGLPSNNVVKIYQDHDGLMWFATYNGLASYDGYKFQTYNYSPTDSTTINHDIVLFIGEESSRYLWVGTYKGFSRFDKEQNQFQRFTTPSLGILANAGIREIVKDDNGRLWLATNQGLAIYDIENDSTMLFTHDPGNDSTICSSYILDIHFDRHDQVWLGTREGLDVYNLKTKTFKHLYKGQEFERVIDYNGGILAITRHYNRYFTPSATDIRFTERLNTVDKPGFVFTDILPDYQGGDWYTIRDHGVYKDLLGVDKKVKYTYSKYNSQGMNSNVPQCIFRDRDDNLWIGTYDGGVNFYSPHRKIFHNIRDNFRSDGLMNNKVKTIYQDNDGDIWIGTKINGMLSKFDRQTHTFVHYQHDPDDPESLSDEYIFSLTDAEPGYLWVGTMLGGLNHFNKKNGKCRMFKHDPSDPASISSNNIRALLVDDNVLWIAHHRLGVDKFSLKTMQKVRNYQTDGISGDVSSNSINVIYKDSKNNLWLGTITGLNRYDKENDTFQSFIYSEDDPEGISDNMVLCIHEDQNKNLWIGTKNGLNRFDHETQTFEKYNTSHGLPSNSIFGLSSDANDNLWMSTNIGICRFNWKTNESWLYTVEDGLQSNEFVPSVYETSDDGDIFFGGNEGFTYFNPEHIKTNPNIPNVIITDFKIFNKPVDVRKENNIIKKHITHAEQINLKHHHNVFSFEFTALNYNSTEKNQYAYKMEGFDKDWQHVGTRRTATYTNLNPGDYTFRVIASNNDERWNNEGVSIDLSITPPWWKTWFFKIVLMLSIMGLIRLMLVYRTRHYQQQKALLEQKVKERTLKLNNANNELTRQKEEILQQNNEIQNQTKEIISQRDEISSQKESLEKESKKIQLLNQFGQQLTNVLNLDAIQHMIYDYVSTIVDTSVFAIGLYIEEKKALAFSSFIDNGQTVTNVVIGLDDQTNCAVWCYNNQQHILMNNVKKQYTKYVDQIQTISSRLPGSAIYLPLTVKSKHIGVMTIQSNDTNAYTQSDLDTIQTLASYLAIALDNANTHKIVRNQKAELEQQHTILEQQVQERTKDLEAAKFKAEESDRLKSSFLANMSHEIRTPLNAIIGFSNIIVSNEYEESEREKLGRYIEQNSYSLLNIISDIIDFSKIEAGQMNFNKSNVMVDLFFNEIQQSLRMELDSIGKRKVELRLKTASFIHDPVLQTDPYRLKQIFNNLIGNAMKFTEQGYIEFGYKSIDDEFLVLYVKDTGIGLKPEHREIIFERFRKIEEDKKTIYRGTGLGLSITKYLVELMGGAIWVESEYGQGSEFCFKLPLSKTQTSVLANGKEQKTENGPETPNWSQKTILVVEDEVSNYNLLLFMLRPTNINIEWAQDGNEAIHKFRQQQDKIDLVLLDIKLPKKDGFEVVKEMRNISSNTPIIAQTAYAMQIEEEKIRSSGFDDYISKPFVMRQMINTMSPFL